MSDSINDEVRIGNAPNTDEEEGPEKDGTASKFYGDDGPSFNWRTTLRNELVAKAKQWSGPLGVSNRVMEAYVKDNYDLIWRSVQGDVRKRGIFTDGDVMQVGDPGSRNPSPREWQEIFDKALNQLSLGLGFDLSQSPSRGGGRGGGGSRGPTAQDIRNSMDEQELTDAVQKFWGAYLLEDNPNAKQIARAYIDAVVSTGGQKEIDFETFVKNKMRKTSRWGLLYQNKPEGVDELSYVKPYMDLARSVVGGNNPGSVAAGGAALGATSEAFQQRLLRTDEATASKGFINNLESRMAEVNGVLRG